MGCENYKAGVGIEQDKLFLRGFFERYENGKNNEK